MKLNILFGALFIFSAQLTNAQSGQADELKSEINWSEDISQNLDEEIRSYMDLTHTQGLALAIIKNGEVLKKRFYGLADAEEQIPVSGKSEFWLASISKHLTTALVLDLEEDSILSRSDLIIKYLPNLPESMADIKLEHLMSHTSGIEDDHSGDEDSFYNRLNTFSPGSPDLDGFESLLPLVKVSFPAGERYLYSDTGMMILALVASKAAGKPFYRLMQERIFEPANMASYLNNPMEEHPNQVTGYSWANWELQKDQNRVETLNADQRLYGGAGSLFVTLDDMINWNQALNENRILEEPTKTLLWENYQLSNGESTGSGLGLMRIEYPGGVAVGHNGIAGTEYWKFPDRNIDIILLTNHGMNLSSYQLASLVAEKLGLLSDIEADMLLNFMSQSRAAHAPEHFPLGKYSVVGPFPAEVFIEFYKKDQKAYALIQGLQYELIPLESGGFLGYSKAIFFPGAPAPHFVLENDGVSWIMGPNKLSLTKMSED